MIEPPKKNFVLKMKIKRYYFVKICFEKNTPKTTTKITTSMIVIFLNGHLIGCITVLGVIAADHIIAKVVREIN